MIDDVLQLYQCRIKLVQFSPIDTVHHMATDPFVEVETSRCKFTLAELLLEDNRLLIVKFVCGIVVRV